MEDTRWKQRFHNFRKAFAQLSRFVKQTGLNEMEEQGLIQSFEYTFELGWKTLQDLLEEESGYLDVKGPKPVLMKAFQDGILSEGEIWMEMLKDRNRTVHTYDEKIAREIIQAVTHDYYRLLAELEQRLMKLM